MNFLRAKKSTRVETKKEERRWDLAEHDQQKDDEDEDVMKNKESERKEKEEKATAKWVQSYDKTHKISITSIR